MAFFQNKNPELKRTRQLHAAARQSRPELVRILLQKGARAKLELAGEGYTGNALHALAGLRHVDCNDRDFAVMDILMQHVSIDSRNADGLTPLMVAAAVRHKQDGTAPIMQALINRGADVKARTPAGATAAHMVCADSTSYLHLRADVLKTLIDNGADINAADNEGVTPLMLAADSGSHDLYAMLVQNGANIHQRDKKGFTASKYAMARGHYAFGDQIAQREAATPDTKPSRDASLAPQVEWHALDLDRIARVSIEEPVSYRLTEIFNFRSQTYTCITQNLVTKVEAVTVRSFSEFQDPEFIAIAQLALGRKTGSFVIGKSANPLRRPPNLKLGDKK